MKRSFPFSILMLLVLCFSCKPKPVDHQTIPEAGEIETVQIDTLIQDAKKAQNPNASRHHVIYYVRAESGLNYRDAPKGNRIGQFPLNTAVKVIYRTGVSEQVQDENQMIEGEWVGIEMGTDTVYVFDGFLSDTFAFSDLDIYITYGTYGNQGELSGLFVNLSESFPLNYDTEEPGIIPADQLGKDLITFGEKERKQFLYQTGISNRDTIFLYNLKADSIFKFPVRNLSVIATVNAYAEGSKDLQDFDYEFGFSLDNQYDTAGETFAFVGQQNPFQTGRIQSIVWKAIQVDEFPKNYPSLQWNDLSWLDSYSPKEAYQFSRNNLNYKIQILTKDKQYYRLLLIFDAKTDQLLYESFRYETESTFFNPLAIEGADNQYEYQWTGEIFKNKPTMIYGLYGESFGCPMIEFIGQGEAPILILCDNRH